MKTNRFFAFLMAAATLSFGACGSDSDDDEKTKQENDITEITMNKSALSIEVGASEVLSVAFTPAGTSGTLVWTSQDTDIATVNNGTVTGVAEGSTSIVATCGSLTTTCAVTVTKKADPLPEGTNYYVIAMDETTFGKLGDKVVKDLRMNGAYEEECTHALEIWGGTFEAANTISGSNSFGELEDYINLKSVTGENWGLGCGGIRMRENVDLTAIDDDYTLVIAYKGPASNGNNTFKFTLYSTITGGAEPFKEVSGNTNGEWVIVEYPMSELFAEGLDWATPFTYSTENDAKAFYSIGLLANGIGTELNVDAVYIYKKAAK